MVAAAFCCMTMTVTMTSCTSDNFDNPVTPPEPQQLAEYTIIYYANGGANVDHCVLPMLGDFYKADPDAYKKVNVVVQYKFSTAENLKKQGYSDVVGEWYGGKTVRWAVDPNKDLDTQMSEIENLYGEDNADCMTRRKRRLLMPSR